ncbi:hypothetical protein [Candidatus Ruthturnera calyptogenae]|uniref:hypothetical protein n=1 Tax=Candidatus Ruthturnera calyptogenae TaxID=386487 RepID=UPI00031FF7B8|nr:hypothetical protein [Candidatus Ruthturnera calyptogenae]
MKKAFDKNPYLLLIPVGFMIFIANLLSKKLNAIYLSSLLQVDNSKIRNLLGWQPVLSLWVERLRGSK